MILAALDEVGGKDYLVDQARNNPNAFLTLIGKVLPTQIQGDVKAGITLEIRRFTDANSSTK